MMEALDYPLSSVEFDNSQQLEQGKSMKKYLSICSAVLITLVVLLAGCSGVPTKEKQEKAKEIILQKYPDFETQIQNLIKEQHPNFLGIYGYLYENSEQENIIIVKYGIGGGDWVEFINPFSTKQTTNIYYSFKVDMNNKTVSSESCTPNDPWWSSQKKTCGE